MTLTFDFDLNMVKVYQQATRKYQIKDHSIYLAGTQIKKQIAHNIAIAVYLESSTTSA